MGPLRIRIICFYAKGAALQWAIAKQTYTPGLSIVWFEPNVAGWGWDCDQKMGTQGLAVILAVCASEF
ncbi:hypothetical protein MHY01S_24240 [Meiothermus hypogaeus NBRC 106114]|uniref:Uncharacterized protein n=1 Tax=Meiothermus hypogaeus NBRC 106114 TaxID=1227553 RepID=A0A511R3S9_9DEIN|nr:hypothetical protein MHY01S_24240 [Meiothermus hypogaeus NBRC 106114]